MVLLLQNIMCVSSELHWLFLLDFKWSFLLVFVWLFSPGSNTTHPMRGATRRHRKARRTSVISIHAPHAGCDRKPSRYTARISNFNPRTPCGVRQSCLIRRRTSCNFNPRTPCGVRRSYLFQSVLTAYFNPRTPCGVRRLPCSRRPRHCYFNPRTPCGVRR